MFRPFLHSPSFRVVARSPFSQPNATPVRYSLTAVGPTYRSLHFRHHPAKNTAGLLLVQAEAPTSRKWSAGVWGVSHFHSSPTNRGGPLVPLILGALKASTTLEVARTTARIALTFLPILFIKNWRSRKYLTYHAKIHGKPVSEEKKTVMLKRIRNRTILFHILLFTPITLFWLAIVASMERTPLTGRWRLIILSPEEEDEIAAQLAGPKWYQAILDILSIEGPPRLVPPTDWRHEWVRDTLRRLEGGVPVLQRERDLAPEWLERGPNDVPLPPPAEYPLRPRPRAAEYVRRFCEMTCGRTVPPPAHTIPGPPYSLVIVDKPDACNAFSYGFGPDGGGGVVVYSGFLDQVLSKITPSEQMNPSLSEETSWWKYLFGGFSISPPDPPHPVPTAEQTSELAILLSHELAHLILSHHLETLSSGTIMVPAMMSMVADVVRTLLFPFTMLFGPFVNDAVAQLGKAGSGELIKIGEYCTSTSQEIEADVVSARLLAHAGFDARQAVSFWENRQDTPKTAECSSSTQSDDPASGWILARRIMGSGHPVNELRVEKLKGELVRWELEKRVAQRRMGEEDIQRPSLGIL